MTAKLTSNLIPRPPVVAVMGHIDHGKSTLLDYIRKTNIVDKETGGITQTISAYEIKGITFLDTPGHAAFVSLRDRGAKIADIAILVVSAEDGVKPQTVEALRSIKEASLPFIVAINKIDKPTANIERTKQTLAENEIYIEGYGGDIPCLPISAKTGEGVPELLDMIILMSELQEKMADPTAPAIGIVLESDRSKGKGIGATLIIRNGTLKSGMFVVAGKSLSPVRIFENFLEKNIKEASFSSPVRVIGFDTMPEAGTPFRAFVTKKEAETHLEKILTDTEPITKVNQIGQTEPIDPEAVLKHVIPVLVKGASAGAVEAIEHEVAGIVNDRITFKIVSKGIGDISEADVKLASGKADTIILGFDVKVDGSAKSLAERLNLELQVFDIIYKLTEYLQEAAISRAPKMTVEEETGRAKILKLFSHVKDKQVLGGRAEEGIVVLGEEVKIFRREAEIGRGHIRELQKMKAKVGQVESGSEFGAMIESKIELAPGDKIVCFRFITK